MRCYNTTLTYLNSIYLFDNRINLKISYTPPNNGNFIETFYLASLSRPLDY